jgi:hypothetical protein
MDIDGIDLQSIVDAVVNMIWNRSPWSKFNL